MQPFPIIQLKAGRDKSVRHGHPWIFSGAIERMPPNVTDGDTVDVVDAAGRWLARGLVEPSASLAARIYTRNADELLDAGFFRRRIERAIALRHDWLGPAFLERTDAYRLVFSESDGLSGLIVDRYAHALRVQVHSHILLAFLPDIVDHLLTHTGATSVVVDSAEDARGNLSVQTSALARLSRGESQPVCIRESGFTYEIDLVGGQKTGFFLDQRENRIRTAAYAHNRRVLSAYCYTGGFEVHCAAAGAGAITGIDRSEPALAKARRHHELNHTPCPVEYIREDVPEALRRLQQADQKFDLIILDPPRLVATRAQKERGLRAYKDINRLAMSLLSGGGILATFSCSGQVGHEDFRTMLAWAATDAAREVHILESLGQPADHPVLTAFPESEYLKGCICRISNG